MNIDVHVPSDLSGLIASSSTPSSPLELGLVERLMGGRAALPMLPAVAQSALELVNDPDASVAEFATLIDKDPPIAARFLSVANSALYSRGRKVTSMEEAVMRLGIYGCRDLLMQVVYASTLTGLKKYQPQVQASFRSSVVSGLICRAVCAELDVLLREAYLCGLLHNIGESRTYRVLSELPDSAEPEAVIELVHRYHERAGLELAKLWKLPDEIQEVCRSHHAEGPPASDALRVVRIADLVVEQVLQRCDGATRQDEAFDEGALEELGLTASQARAIIERAAEMASKA